MAYKAQVYVDAKNKLDERRNNALKAQEMRHSAVLLKCPEIAEIEKEMASYGAAAVKAVALGSDAEEFVLMLSEKSLEAQRKRKELLKNSGFPEDYLDAKFSCSVCRDTGFHDGYYCECYKTLIKETAKKQLPFGHRLEECSFKNFNRFYYPDLTDPILGVNQKDHMASIVEYCKEWAKDFSRSSGGIIMLGQTGLGKTHLSLAIAGVVVDKGYNVYYNSVQNIMNSLEKEHFGRSKGEESIDEDLYESDLLILDDLGAEFITQFTVSQLYNIINTRMIKGLPIIISTNLSMKEIEDKYSQRIASRIIGNTMPLYFCGKDVRQIINS
ncbi:MAG: ATP-binding protein [Clostridia bacterium]|nr:ATP-binding protein [Clostridia bacterium]